MQNPSVAAIAPIATTKKGARRCLPMVAVKLPNDKATEQRRNPDQKYFFDQDFNF